MNKAPYKIRSLILEYLKESIKSGEVDIRLIKSVFLTALEDFLNKKIDIYELEALSSFLYYEISKPEEINIKDKKLGSVLDVASDITFYKKDNKRFKEIIVQLEMYLKENSISR